MSRSKYRIRSVCFSNGIEEHTVQVLICFFFYINYSEVQGSDDVEFSFNNYTEAENKVKELLKKRSVTDKISFKYFD